LLIRDMVATGRHAVILSTHMVEAVGAFCTDVVFMAEGRLAHRWTTADLRAARAGEGGFEAAVMSRIMDAAAIGAEARF
jgi:ABC-2 type transport system ATP-binding protein